MPRPNAVSRAFARIRAEENRLDDWMRAHHDELLAEYGGSRVNWRRTLRVLHDLALTDSTGKPPTKETARKIWGRVRAAVAKDRARRQAKPAPELAPGEIAPAVRAVANAPGAGPAAPVWPRREQRKPDPATDSGRAPPPDGAAIPDSAAPDQPGQTVPPEVVAQRMQALYATIQAGKVPMPKVIPRPGPRDSG